MLTARLAKGLTGLRALRSDWERLHAATGARLFQSFAWAEAWGSVIENDGGGEIRILVVEETDRLCIVPLIVQRRLGIRRLRWLGMEVTDYCDVIASDDWDVPALARVVNDKLPTADIVELRQIRPDSLAARLFAPWVNPGSPEYYCPHIGVADCRPHQDILYAERRAEANQRLGYHIAAGDAEQAELVAFVIAQKRLALIRQGKSTAEFDRAIAPFLRSLPALRYPENARPYFSWLTAGDQTIAAQIGFIEDDTMLYYLPAFDFTFQRHSPGHLLMLNLLRDAQRNGMKTIDLLRGQESYKFKWTDTVAPLSAAECVRTWRGEAFAFARRVGRRL